jgi:hypothetical protein
LKFGKLQGRQTQKKKTEGTYFGGPNQFGEGWNGGTGWEINFGGGSPPLRKLTVTGDGNSSRREIELFKQRGEGSRKLGGGITGRAHVSADVLNPDVHAVIQCVIISAPIARIAAAW